jgi:acetylornithine/N-succinyldiaminopimelate aminotransferase
MGSPIVTGVRGLGLMLGVELQGERTNKEIAALLLEHGLLTLTAGKNVLRLLPPLTISKEELDKGLEIMKDVLVQ